MCLHTLYCTHYLCVPLFPTYTAITITITVCSTQLYAILITQLFCAHVTSYEADWILTDCLFRGLYRVEESQGETPQTGEANTRALRKVTEIKLATVQQSNLHKEHFPCFAQHKQ